MHIVTWFILKRTVLIFQVYTIQNIVNLKLEMPINLNDN